MAAETTQQKKMTADDLLKMGVMSVEDMNTLISRAKEGTGKGIVFAGPPRGGKTTVLNWLLEDGYKTPDCPASVTLIQRHGELFLDHPAPGDRVFTGSGRGGDEMAADIKKAVMDCAPEDVVVIGDVSREDINYAVKAGLSGCRTAFTMHASSPEDAVDNLTSYVMSADKDKDRGQARQLVRQLFPTVVYMEDFRVKQICTFPEPSSAGM